MCFARSSASTTPASDGSDRLQHRVTTHVSHQPHKHRRRPLYANLCAVTDGGFPKSKTFAAIMQRLVVFYYLWVATEW